MGREIADGLMGDFFCMYYTVVLKIYQAKIFLYLRILTGNISQTHKPQNIVVTHRHSYHTGCSGRHVAV